MTENVLKSILIGLLLDLNERGLINNHDFDYEKEVRNYIKTDNLELRDHMIKQELKSISKEINENKLGWDEMRDNAIKDVLLICKLNRGKKAINILKEQYLIINKQDI